MRARVERLLRGDFRADDLTRLFLYARDRCDGRESVQEIGDFVAHHSERTKGIVTRETRDWFLTVRYIVPTMKRPFAADSLPPNFREILSATFRRSGVALKAAGISQSRARQIFPSLCEKFITNSDGTLSISLRHSGEELKLMNFLSGLVTGHAAFTAAKLNADLSATLQKLNLLERSERKAFERVAPTVALFAVSLMHNCVIQIDDSSFAKLYAFNHVGQKIAVYAEVPTTNPIKGGSIAIASPIFVTDLVLEDWCTAELLSLPQPWECDLEIALDGKLGRLF